MRISDWSSDVCSSDLIGPYASQAADRDMQQKQIAAFLRAGHDFELARRFVGAGPGETVGEEEERSEEHTSELQSLMRISYAVFCLKKKIKTKTNIFTAAAKKKNNRGLIHT